MAASGSGCISQAPGSAGGHLQEPSGLENGRNLGVVFPLPLPWAMPLVVAASLPCLQLPEDRLVLFLAESKCPINTEWVREQPPTQRPVLG